MVKRRIENSGLLITRTLHRHKHQLRDFFNISKYAGPVKVFTVMNFMILSTLFTAVRVHRVPSSG